LDNEYVYSKTDDANNNVYMCVVYGGVFICEKDGKAMCTYV
jgi:hypothetical protein